MERVNAFEFATATRIIFGTGSVDQVPNIAAGFGQRALLVTGGQATLAKAERLDEVLKVHNISVRRYGVSGEPDVKVVEDGVHTAKAARCDHVIALGGGSMLDTGKAIAGLLTNGGGVLDYVEVVGRGKGLVAAAAPMIAI